MGRTVKVVLDFEQRQVILVLTLVTWIPCLSTIQIGPWLVTLPLAQCLCLESQSGDGAAKFPGLRLHPRVPHRSAVIFNCRWKAGAGSKCFIGLAELAR